jgi:hypothetical protein
MARTGTARRRVNSRSDETHMQYAVDGSVARNPRAVASRRYADAVAGRAARTVPQGRTKTRSKTAPKRRIRTAAGTMTAGYVLFLAITVICTVFVCVQYLRLKETVTNQINTNESLASRLVTLKSENDALLESVNNSIDWAYIRDTAINELGMKYADQDQIVWYNSDDSRYVRQYEDVPAD